MTGAPQGAHGRSSRIDCYQLLINLCHVYVTSLWFIFCPLGLHVFLFADSWSTIHRFVLPYPSQRGQGSTCSQTDLDEAAVAKTICEVLWNDGYPEYCRNYIEYNQTSRTGPRHGATGMCVGGERYSTILQVSGVQLSMISVGQISSDSGFHPASMASGMSASILSSSPGAVIGPA
jgi:hypothetical protein